MERDMNETGFIHFDCFCGADLYFLVSPPDTDGRSAAKDTLIQILEHPHYAIYSTLDGDSGDCPHCGALVELPDAETVDFLRQLSWKRIERDKFTRMHSGPMHQWNSSPEIEPLSGSLS